MKIIMPNTSLLIDLPFNRDFKITRIHHTDYLKHWISHRDFQPNLERERAVNFSSLSVLAEVPFYRASCKRSSSSFQEQSSYSNQSLSLNQNCLMNYQSLSCLMSFQGRISSRLSQRRSPQRVFERVSSYPNIELRMTSSL